MWNKAPQPSRKKNEMLVAGPYHTRISCIPSGHLTAIEHGHCHSCVVHSFCMFTSYIQVSSTINHCQPPFSYGFPMVFPWFSHGFPLCVWFSSTLAVTPADQLRDICQLLLAVSHPRGQHQAMQLLRKTRYARQCITCVHITFIMQIYIYTYMYINVYNAYLFKKKHTYIMQIMNINICTHVHNVPLSNCTYRVIKTYRYLEEHINKQIQSKPDLNRQVAKFQSYVTPAAQLPTSKFTN